MDKEIRRELLQWDRGQHHGRLASHIVWSSQVGDGPLGRIALGLLVVDRASRVRTGENARDEE